MKKLFVFLLVTFVVFFVSLCDRREGSGETGMQEPKQGRPGILNLFLLMVHSTYLFRAVNRQ